MKPQQLKQLIREEIKNITKSLTEGKYDADLDKIEAAVKNASSFMNVGAELKKAGIKYDFSTSMIPMYTVKVSGNKIAIVNKKYAAGAEREVKDIAIGLLEGVNESVDMNTLSDELKQLIKKYPGKKITYSFITNKDYPKGYVFLINGKVLKEVESSEDHE
jgi:galactitol-specific phosphotransferase system IIB component